jgi:hypothetical protein
MYAASHRACDPAAKVAGRDRTNDPIVGILQLERAQGGFKRIEACGLIIVT